MTTKPRTVTLTISLSANPAVAGRYFLDLRETTDGASTQIATLTGDAERIDDYVSAARLTLIEPAFALTITDTTEELGY